MHMASDRVDASWGGQDQSSLEQEGDGEDVVYSLEIDPNWLGHRPLSPGEGKHPGWWDRIVVRDITLWRQVWDVIFLFMLGYIATVFPYRVSFLDLGGQNPKGGDWSTFDTCIDVLFGFDLFVNFIFSYRDSRGREVLTLYEVVRHYMFGFFIVNLAACVPAEVLVMVSRGGGKAHRKTSYVGQSFRLLRLQRLSRLVRLTRLASQTRLLTYGQSTEFWVWVQTLRGIRVMNFMAGLLWSVHLVACGWFLIAALRANREDTWVFRRVTDSELGTTLWDSHHVDQWLTSMYFVLTVFTTVGFGDMYALNNYEIVYVMCTMILGLAVNSIVLSEVITVLTEVDQLSRDLKEQKALVDDFSVHSKMSVVVARDLQSWARSVKTARRSINRDEMKELFTSDALPRSLISQMVNGLFNGELIRNRFLTITRTSLWSAEIHPRMAILVALYANPRYFENQETVYFNDDSAWNIFLVLRGVFCHIARPSPNGGTNAPPPMAAAAEVMAAAAMVSKTGAVKRGTGDAAKSGNIMYKAMDGIEKFTGIKKSRTSPKSNPTTQNHDRLCPYQFFMRGNYFGEVELLLMENGPRSSCVRCEDGPDSEVLVLSKKPLMDLVAQFPHSANAWRAAAKNRERQRNSLIARLTVGRSYADLAAWMIQHYWRHRGQSGLRSPKIKRTFSRRGAPELMPHYINALTDDVKQLRSEVENLKCAVESKVAGLQHSLNEILCAVKKHKL